MIENHILVGAQFKQTPNIHGSKIVGPKYLIIHYSASGDTAGTVSWLTKKGSNASAHIVIGRDGEVWQLASFDQRAWHCGESEYKGLKFLNGCSIGIEFVNQGPLTKDSDGVFWSKWRHRIPANEVEEATHKNETEPRYWHKFTPEQLAKGAEIAREILTTYPTIEDVIGHDDIAPGRKIDPGPLFPMEDFRKVCFGAPQDEVITEVWIGRVCFKVNDGRMIVSIGDDSASLSSENTYFVMDWVRGKLNETLPQDPSPPPTALSNRAAHFERFEDEIVITTAEDGGDEVEGYMTLSEARALRDWLNEILKA